MNTARYGFLILRALFEIMRYDGIVSSLGIGRILRQLRKQHVSVKPCSEEVKSAICDAVLLATCFYWKPVLCLQRSVCTVRLLRKYGIDARLAIGYRACSVLFPRLGRGRWERRVRLLGVSATSSNISHRIARRSNTK